MKVEVIDRAGTASALASEGGEALGRGHTILAAAKYAEAGNLLLREARTLRKSASRALASFLSASQFYHGGSYETAVRIARQIEQRLLPPQARLLFPGFLKDARDRASAEYPHRVQRTLAKMWERDQFEQMLDVLKRHPYIYRQDFLALGRGVLCDRLGRWKAAAHFYAIAIRESNNRPWTVAMALGRALSLPPDVSVDDAYGFVTRLGQLVTDPVISAATSLLCFNRAQGLTGEDRDNAQAEQLRRFDDYRAADPAGLAADSTDELATSVVALCYEAAARAMMRLGQEDRAATTAEEAVRLNPSSPAAFTTRGILHYPSARAIEDLRRAISLPNCGYAAFYFLAHDAFLRQDFIGAEDLIRSGLNLSPGKSMRGQMVAWLAVFRDCLNAPVDEVDGLFRDAMALVPQDQRITDLYAIFKNTLIPTSGRLRSRWDAHLRVDILRDDGPSRSILTGRPSLDRLTMGDWQKQSDKNEWESSVRVRDLKAVPLAAVSVSH